MLIVQSKRRYLKITGYTSLSTKNFMQLKIFPAPAHACKAGLFMRRFTLLCFLMSAEERNLNLRENNGEIHYPG
jgi:hypothetical protein